MPTIDELPPAVSVSDGDELVVSQSDIARKATRAQILAGVQPAIALASGSILGRISGGVGAPEAISIGANLSVANGAMSGSAPFIVSQLSEARAPQATDLVAVSQGGQNAAMSYSMLMGGLSGIQGIDGSRLVATATGATGPRCLDDYLADSISIECFGALGDGVTDDTAAFQAAIVSGRTLRLDSRIYVINGSLMLFGTPALLGVPGGTVILRRQVVGSEPWVTVASATFYMYGILFDSGHLSASDLPAVSFALACEEATLCQSQFLRAHGINNGHGLSLTLGSNASFTLDRCTFSGNDQSGLVVAGEGHVTVANCIATANGNSGIAIAATVGCILIYNTSNDNMIGISIGAWSGFVNGQANGPTCRVEHNSCLSNLQWGIAAAGYAATIVGNYCEFNGSRILGGALLARVSNSRITQNTFFSGNIGIDARASYAALLTDNHISDCNIGIAIGGSQNCVLRSNFLIGCVWGIQVTGIEPSLSFTPTGPLTIGGNWIGYTSPQCGGIQVLDGAFGISVIDNDFNGWGSAIPNQALWLHTDAAIVGGNRWNNQAQIVIQGSVVAGRPTLVVPDFADDVLVTSSPAAISSVLTMHQADTLGEISFFRVTAGGSGYTQAQVTVLGEGRGASADAIVANGQVVWITLANPGSGYGSIGTGVQVVVTGDGVGAAATGYVGVPVLNGRRLHISCNLQIQFDIVGSSPPFQSWTGFAITVPALGAAAIEGAFGGWRLAGGPSVEYLMPSGTGDVTLQSAADGNVTLRPARGGALLIANAAEPAGCSSNVGRGAPTGQVTAVPGSDYRNLDGGAGSTFWVKRTGTDSQGWFAIA